MNLRKNVVFEYNHTFDTHAFHLRIIGALYKGFLFVLI